MTSGFRCPEKAIESNRVLAVGSMQAWWEDWAYKHDSDSRFPLWNPLRWLSSKAVETFGTTRANECSKTSYWTAKNYFLASLHPSSP